MQRNDKEGVTALCHACHKGRTQVAKFLIESGSDVSQSDKSGRTPLDAASSQCNPEIVEVNSKKKYINAFYNCLFTAHLFSYFWKRTRLLIVLTQMG